MDLATIQSPSSEDRQPPKRQHSRGVSRSYSERARSTSADQTTESIPTFPSTSTATPFIAHSPDSRFENIQPAPHSPLPTFPQSHLPSDSISSEASLQSPRPRAYTNPPIALQTFSNGMPLSAPSLSRISFAEHTNLRPHTIAGNSTRNPSNKEPVNVPLPLADTESPEIYLQRLQAAVSKAEVAGILASSIDPFYVKALQTYVGQFDFSDDPLDVALRKLLMEVGLPRETQQIDRVMEAFARRYLHSNPTLFTSEDHPYILAFSLIMLHTDAFNKSNKRKMTKAAYIKNTRLPGVAPEILDCFYDNILFAPFIFIEDQLDVNGQLGLTPETTAPGRIISPSNSILGTSKNNGQAMMKSTKVDPYYLITNNLLGPLRVNVEAYIPTDSPYSYEGTAGPWDEVVLQQAFATAGEIEVGAADHNRTPPLFNISVGGGSPGPIGSLSAFPDPAHSATKRWTLNVTKVGLLNRKDDVLEGGKKASNRKWKTWSVMLTGSQLLFFRDPSWSTSLVGQSGSLDGRRIIYPQSAVFKPDELLSVKDAIAVFDKSYAKYENTLRFVLPDGRQLLLQTSDGKELNEWISRINYASAFKSAGVRMRSMDMSGIDVKLTGVAAATSHLHDLQHRSPKAHTWDGDAPRHLTDMLSGDPQLETTRSPQKGNLALVTSRDDMDLDVPVAPEVDGADQFKATFDQVKADLAAGRWMPSDADAWSSIQASSAASMENIAISPTSVQSEHSRLSSRSQIMQSKVHDLDSKISAAKSQLDADMRFARNIATLTPFQKSTRDRLTTAVQGVAKRIMQVRLKVTKLVCHRSVLLGDLASQGRSWHRARTIALQAATETLQTRRTGVIPQMTLSFHDEPSATTMLTSSRHPDTPLPPSHRPESSVCDSFYSAMDFGPEWPSHEDVSSSDFLGTSRRFDSPERNNSRSSSLTRPDIDTGSPRCNPNRSSSSNVQNHSEDASPRTSDDFRSHERYYTAHEIPKEQAEAWNKTRCAQRVSLVRLPSDMQMSTRFQRFHTGPPHS